MMMKVIRDICDTLTHCQVLCFLLYSVLTYNQLTITSNNYEKLSLDAR
jgi:hypothetical protein